MGGNFLAIKDNDINLTLANPSLIGPGMNKNLSLSFVDYFTNVNYGYAIYSQTFEKIGSFTGAMQYLDYGEFTYADETGMTSGNFYVSDLAFSLGWGRALDSSFSIGANLKFINSTYERYSSFGIATDVSGSYFNKSRNLTISLLARNIGSQITTFTSGNREPLPFELQLGISKRLQHVPFRYSFLFTNLQKWDLTYEDPANPSNAPDPLTGEPVEENKFSDIADKVMRHIVIGGELSPGKVLSFRLGYNYQRRQEMKVETKLSTVGISWGLGLNISKFQFSYARSAYHLSGSPNFITISTNLGEFF